MDWKQRRDKGIAQLGYGFLAFVIGIGLTWWSLSSRSFVIIVAWGPVLYGVISMIAGAVNLSRAGVRYAIDSSRETKGNANRGGGAARTEAEVSPATQRPARQRAISSQVDGWVIRTGRNPGTKEWETVLTGPSGIRSWLVQAYPKSAKRQDAETGHNRWLERLRTEGIPPAKELDGLAGR
ncbi:MAG TPA: hypothetical protein VGA48_08480 [Thermoplasmata archaeon]